MLRALLFLGAWGVQSLFAQNFNADLCRACRAGDSAAVADIIRKYDGNYPEQDYVMWQGYSVGYYAVKGKCAGCIPLLAEHQFLPLDELVDDRLPLTTLAVQEKDPATLRALLASGAEADPYIKKEEYHPMYEALVFQRNAGAAMMLVNAGLDVDFILTRKQLQTPLHYAAQMGNVPLIRFLVEKGADLEAVDKRGNTPIVYAFYFADHAPAVQALLDLGADKTITVNGKTLTAIAEKYQRTECLKVLRQAGAR
ncbi:MAG: ankyrin repeat domain-containing protein [Bacteroidetes bacterium]|nr:ankyrin repeat domain-containing protein [Bacteroidota bacterium]